MNRGLFIDEIRLGQRAALSRIFDEKAVAAFAALTGDANPAHLDEDFAAGTRFGRRIVHGMLGAGLISAVLGTKLPGPGAIYVSQSLQFRAPVFIGEEVTAEVEVTKVDVRRRRVTLATRCLVGGRVVMRGEAALMVAARED